MSLGIFSYDLEALIESWYDFWSTEEPEPLNFEDGNPPALTGNVQPDGASTTKLIDDAAMAAALTSAVTSIISSTAEAAKTETAISPTILPKPKKTLDEAIRREIERLQTQVIHNYRSDDIAGENVSHTTVSNSANRNLREDSDTKNDSIEQRKKSDERRLEILREELKRSILKNNAEV